MLVVAFLAGGAVVVWALILRDQLRKSRLRRRNAIRAEAAAAERRAERRDPGSPRHTLHR